MFSVKKIGYKVLALLLCLVLVCGLATAARSAPNVYFMAVNETVVPMTPENMPFVLGGTLYIPYVMLSPRSNGGVNLGVTAQYSTIHRTVMVSQGQNVVIFDPGANTSYDLYGEPLDGRAVVRNAMVYIPLDWVCRHFGTISYTMTQMEFGTLIRVTNHLAILGDIDFADAATEMLKENYREYLESVGANPGGPSGDDPEQSARPETGPMVYTAFVGADLADEMARLLEEYDRRGLFLLNIDELGQDDLVRRLVGAGHMVGLNVVGNDSASALSQLREGRRLMAAVARCPLTIVRAAEAEEELLQTLEQQGCALWQADVRAEGISSGPELLAMLGEEKPSYLEIGGTVSQLELMTDVMGILAGEGYRLRQTVAPAL